MSTFNFTNNKERTNNNTTTKLICDFGGEHGDKVGFKNENGELVIPYKYDDANNFGGGFSRVKIDDKYGVINNKGEVVIPIEYSELTLDNSGLIFVKK